MRRAAARSTLRSTAPGFFVVERDGKHAYTRNGEFAREADGTLRNAAG